MLTKRTNILFDEDTWDKLVKLARSRNISTSMIIRVAVEKELSDEEMFAQRRKAFEEIKKIRPEPFKGKIDYKELINYGRR